MIKQFFRAVVLVTALDMWAYSDRAWTEWALSEWALDNKMWWAWLGLRLLLCTLVYLALKDKKTQ